MLTCLLSRQKEEHGSCSTARRALKAQRRAPNAFSLIELLVAMVILSLGLLAYVTVATASHAAMDKANYTTIAAQVANDKIADLQGPGYAYLANGTTNYTVSGLPSGTMSVVVGYLDGSAANTNIRQVDVTVSWNAGSSQTPQTAGSFRLSALMANHFPY